MKPHPSVKYVMCYVIGCDRLVGGQEIEYHANL